MNPDQPDENHSGSRTAGSSEAGLWSQWRNDGNMEARALLLELHLPYAKVVAAKLYAGRPYEEFDFEEYLQFATVGLIESMDRYNPEMGAQFRTFAHHRMTGAILSGLERLSDRQQQISLRRRLKNDRASIIQEAGAAHPDHSSQLFQRLADIGIGLALSALLDGSNMVLDDGAWAPDQSYERIELKQFKERLAHMMTQLTEREAQVIHGHYLQSMPFDDIAKMLGISKARVSQLHYQALQRLRRLVTQPVQCSVML